MERITAGSTLPYAVLILTLILAPRIAQALRLPAMVGLVLAGMALGPHGVRALATKEIALSAVGNLGLLYLMFSAGLELDLKLFLRTKRVAITFALLSFAIPFTLGIVSAHLLGYAAAAAVLMGSNWGSHTLVTYPMLRQMGLARNRAVATVVGATAVTDTSALLVLAVISGIVKPTGSLGVQLVGIVVGLALLAVWSLLGLPRVARWFFARVGTDRSYRFVFGIAAFLVGGVLAEAAGIDAIVGSFFAGLGLSRAVPEESALMDRLQFTGSTLFIPIFLVSVGVLLEPKVMIDPKTLGIALVFTVAVLGGKALAAVAAGKSFRFSWAEIGVMSGLSGSQAAATLATTIVGAKLGLFDKQTINAVLVVILVSLVVTPAMVSFFGKRLGAVAGQEAAPLGKAVLVPVWGESSRAVLTLGGKLASTDGGIVLAASFADELEPEPELVQQRALTGKAEEWLAKEGLESKTIFRVARSVPEGLLEAIVGEDATLLVAEWRVDAPLDEKSEAFQMLARSPVPVVIAHGDFLGFERLLLVSRAAGDPGLGQSLRLAVEVGARFAHGRRLVAVSDTLEQTRSLFPAKTHVDEVEAADPVTWLERNLEPHDLPLFVGAALARDAEQRIPALVAGRFLVAVAAAGGQRQERERPIPRSLVSGRSLRPRPA